MNFLADAVTVAAPEYVETIKAYITTGGTVIGGILTAGCAIVGAFYLWRLVKRSLGASK